MSSSIKSSPKAKRVHILMDDSGATSILVIIFMIVLLVFGMAALTTSLASYKLANKNVDYIYGYYQVEGLANQQMLVLDRFVSQAETNAVQSLKQLQLNAQDVSLPEPVMAVIRENYPELTQIPSADLSNIFNAFYLYYLESKVLELAQTDGTWGLSIEKNYINAILKSESQTYMAEIQYQVQTEEKIPKLLTVGLEVPTPELTLQLEGDIQVPSVINNLYAYKIIRWQESQDAFKYSEGTEFEDPQFEEADPFK